MAQIFGLIEGRQKVSLTPLGREIVDPQRAADARARAFLAVPLYQKVFERYRGHLLPPDVGLERQMVDFGVAAKQRDKARQAFQRSAQQAGFFAQGRDKLVLPIGTMPVDEKGAEATEDGTGRQQHEPLLGGSDGSGQRPPTPTVHPMIAGFLGTLPPEGTKLSRPKLERLKKAFEATLEVIYEIEDEA